MLPCPHLQNGGNRRCTPTLFHAPHRFSLAQSLLNSHLYSGLKIYCVVHTFDHFETIWYVGESLPLTSLNSRTRRTRLLQFMLLFDFPYVHTDIHMYIHTYTLYHAKNLPCSPHISINIYVCTHAYLYLYLPRYSGYLYLLT